MLSSLIAACRRRPLLLGALTLALVLAAAYSFSIEIRSSRYANITGDEPFYLLTTESLLRDGDLDLNNQYEGRRYESFFDHPDGLWKQSVPAADGRLLSPHDPGLSWLVLPGFALDGLRGVKFELLFIAALTFALTYVFVARVTGDSLWSWLATLGIGLSPTAFVYSSAIYPEMPAALLAVTSLLFLTSGRLGLGKVAAVAVSCSALAWLGAKYVPLAALLGAYAMIKTTPAARWAFASVTAVSAAGYLWFHMQTYGGPTPYSVNVIYDGASAAQMVDAHLAFRDRFYRLWGIFLDRHFGLARWAPVLLPTAPALVLLLRKDGHFLLPASLIACQLGIAVFAAITMMGWWFPGRTLVTVLPLFVLPLALLLARAGPKQRVLLIALSVATVATTTMLGIAGNLGEITTAVDPFEMDFWVFQAAGALFPDYRAWTVHTWLATSAWLVVWAAITLKLLRPAFGQRPLRVPATTKTGSV